MLIGDPKQLPSVDSGGLVHRIVAEGHHVVDDLVRVNQRQRLEADRQMLDRLRGGEVRAAVRDYAEAGRIHLGRDEYSTKAAMVDAWWDDIHTAQRQTATHAYADAGVRGEHGYTALSRARGETHLWINDSPGPLGGCTHVYGDPLTEDHIDALVRQLSQSVIEPPAHDQGLPVQIATDRQLIDWRDELESTIRLSPIETNDDDKLTALEAAIDAAREFADRIGTTGALAQVQALEAQRSELVGASLDREAWLEENVGLIHNYSAWPWNYSIVSTPMWPLSNSTLLKTFSMPSAVHLKTTQLVDVSGRQRQHATQKPTCASGQQPTSTIQPYRPQPRGVRQPCTMRPHQLKNPWG